MTTVSTAPLLSFVVEGTPRPRQRARRASTGTWYTPRETREYQRAIGWAVANGRRGRQLPLGGYSGVCIDVRAYMPDRRRRDLDGVMANILDALVKAGVLVDDAHAHVPHQTITGEVDRVRPRVEVTIRRVG